MVDVNSVGLVQMRTGMPLCPRIQGPSLFFFRCFAIYQVVLGWNDLETSELRRVYSV